VCIGLLCVSIYGAYLNLYRALLVLLRERIWGLVQRGSECVKGSFGCR